MAHQSDYIQLKDIKHFVQESLQVLRAQWYVPFGLFLILGGYKVFRAWTYAPEYEARLSFMIAEEPIGLEASLGGVLSSIGLSSESSYNHERFIQLAKSRKIFQNAVMDTVTIGGSNQLLANALIDEFEQYGRWGKNRWYEFFKDPPALRGFRFRDTQITHGPPLSRLALKTLHQMTGQIADIRYDPDAAIFTYVVHTHSEDLSYHLVRALFDKIADYYVEKTREKHFQTYEVLESKEDSLRGLLREKEAMRARLRDQLRYASSESALVPLEKLSREINLLYIMLGEVVKNKELADFALRSKTPIVQAIDLPLKPLPSYAPLWWMELIRSAVIALLAGGLYVLFRHWWRRVG